jgi:hypothetical protein
MDNHPETQWIAARLAAIAPAWEPDIVRAGARMRAASPPARHLWRPLLAAAATAVIVAAIAPSSRTLAQELWHRWFVTRVAVVRLDLSRIPLESSIRTDAPLRRAASLDDAATQAGFAPALPPVDVAGAPRELWVIGRMDVSQTVRTPAIIEALQREGVADVEVPAAWNGVTLRASIGPIVAAAYPGDVEVLQAPPVRLELPAAFPLARFATTIFRAGGLPQDEARRLGEEFAARPAWLLDVPDDADAVVETVTLPGGSGLLIEDPAESGGDRVTIIVSRPTRIYTVSSPTRDQSLRIAAALPRR